MGSRPADAPPARPAGGPVAAQSRCPGHQQGVAFYRRRYAEWRAVRGAVTRRPVGRRPRSCADARRLGRIWRREARDARRVTERWVADHTLDPRLAVWRIGGRQWERAVLEVQKVMPGTRWVLLSCSSSEGGWGRWVRFGGGAYYPGYRGVGGWLQFLPGTFERHYAAALELARSRGFRVPAEAHSWFSPLGQALAGAWGLTYSRGEWAGAGCR